jgi:hypothetical protein
VADIDDDVVWPDINVKALGAYGRLSSGRAAKPGWEGAPGCPKSSKLAQRSDRRMGEAWESNLPRLLLAASQSSMAESVAGDRARRSKAMLFRKERNNLTVFIEGRVLIAVVLTMGGLVTMLLGGHPSDIVQWVHGLVTAVRVWP